MEVGPRDGLQNEKTSIPLKTKLELIERLAGTGVRRIEAGSFVSRRWVPQVCFSRFVGGKREEGLVGGRGLTWILVDGELGGRSKPPVGPPA